AVLATLAVSVVSASAASMVTCACRYVEGMTNRGRSGGQRGAVDRLVLKGTGGVPPVEGGREIAVERSGAGLEQEVGAFGRPLHRLLLGESLAEQRVDQRLHESRRDRLAGSAPLSSEDDGLVILDPAC